MIELTFERSEQQVSYTLAEQQLAVVGRAAGQAIAFSLPADWSTVSRRHCQLRAVDGGLEIVDLSSANGTFVDGQAIHPNTPHKTSLPCRFTLGSGLDAIHCTAQVSSADKAKDRKPIEAGHTLLQKLGNRKEITIGRSDNCDIVLADSKVSRSHARFFKQGDKFFIEDLGSLNGTFVNNERLSGKRELKATDTVYIGLNALKLKDVIKNLATEAVITAEGIAKVFSNGNRGLHATNLSVEKAEMVAIMGPSGSGKSTLLKMLNGEISLSHGSLKIYGLDFYAHRAYLAAQMGYVPQDDIIHRELTVEQTLRFAARIRLTAALTHDEVQKKITAVLQMVSLDEPKLMKTRVGELSGGQRKRVSIAVELLNEPKLLFLDEPTSPLDPETIDEFLKCLKALTQHGTTVLMVTHKPEDLAYMDRVVFIGTGGYHAYTGQPELMPGYFGADSIISVYSLLSDPKKGKQWHDRIGREVSGPVLKPSATQQKLQKNHVAQLYWQTARYFQVKVGNPVNIAIILLQPLIIALLVAVAFDAFRLNMPAADGTVVEVADTGLIFLISLAAVWFGVSLSAKEIVSERAIYSRERKVQLSPLVYLLSKQVVLGSLLMVQLLIFTFTLMVKYGSSMYEPLETLGFLFVLGSAAILFGLALSAFADSAESVMSILPIALMPQIILSGIVSPVKSPLMEVLSYLTFGRWGTEGLARIQDHTADASGLMNLNQQLYSADAMTWCQSMGANVKAIGLLALAFAVLVVYRLYRQDHTA